jgi:hypothetical protein
MAIVNRDLDSSQQVVNMSALVQNTSVGSSYALAVIPCPMQLVGAGVASKGLSGAPNLSLWIERFVVGTGYTAIAIGASLVAQAFGTSGGQTFNVGAGVTYTLQAGDVVSLASAGANTAALMHNVTLALKALQDIKTSFGASV